MNGEKICEIRLINRDLRSAIADLEDCKLRLEKIHCKKTGRRLESAINKIDGAVWELVVKLHEEAWK